MHLNAKKLNDFESIDLDERFNSLSRKMIGDVCRAQLTPVQMNTNLEIKALRRLVDEQRLVMEEYREGLNRCLETVEDLKVATIYSQQNKDKASEGYQRELERLQQLERIRATIDRKGIDVALMKPLSSGSEFLNGYRPIANNPNFNRNVHFNMPSLEQDSIT